MLSNVRMFIATVILLALGASSVLAQTSTRALLADPRASYATIKGIVAKLNRENASPPAVVDGKYNLSTCSEPALYMMESKRRYEDDVVFQSLAWIAIDVLDVAEALSKLGYPAAVWEPIISDFETTSVNAGISAASQGARQSRSFLDGYLDRQAKFFERLATQSQAYQRKNPSLARVVYEPGCGAGEVQVRIVTEPRGGQVLFIPTFFYELCRAQNIDPPEDTKRCNRWREADGGRLSPVVGDYQYIATWRDGTVRKGRLRVGEKDDGRTITLRKQ
jgi:hypothetical protein